MPHFTTLVHERTISRPHVEARCDLAGGMM